MNLPLEALALQYALLFLALGLFFGALLVVTMLVEWIADTTKIGDWFL